MELVKDARLTLEISRVAAREVKRALASLLGRGLLPIMTGGMCGSVVV